MEWADYFAVMDPTNGQKLSGEFRAVLDAAVSSQVKSDVEKEVHFSLCEVLNFSGEPVKQMCADLAELSKAVQDEAGVALARLGALGPLSIAHVRFYAEGEDPTAAWSADLPRFNSTFAALCKKTGLQLAGSVSGRFVGIGPDEPQTLSDSISEALSAVLARADVGVVAYFDNIQLVNDELSAEVAPLLAPANSRGFVVIEKGEFDEKSNKALAADPAVPPAAKAGAKVRVTWTDGKRYDGTLVREGGGQYLVLFPNGTQQWLSPQHVTLLEPAGDE